MTSNQTQQTFKIVSPRRRFLQHRVICSKNCTKPGHKYIDIANFDGNSICFGPAEKITLPNNPNVSFTKIPIYNEIEPGVYSDVLFSTPPEVHCFGIKENLNMTTKVLEGFSIGMAVCDPRSKDEDEHNFIGFLDKLTKKCESFLLSDQGSDITGDPIPASSLAGLCSALSYRMIEAVDSNGRLRKMRDPNKGPTFYAKLLTKKIDNDNNWVMDTGFYENNIDTTNSAFALYCKPMAIQAAIRAENIFISAGISKTIRIQFKVVEVTVFPEYSSKSRLLPPTTPIAAATTSNAVSTSNHFSALPTEGETVEEEKEEEEEEQEE